MSISSSGFVLGCNGDANVPMAMGDDWDRPSFVRILAVTLVHFAGLSAIFPLNRGTLSLPATGVGAFHESNA
ncbi:hypothetical protein [Congregibacter sp.]|uniref:hypothetical protein n=1 Tax=Congregibacter sp. TaxID=2744308 RepID=UPI00385E3734